MIPQEIADTPYLIGLFFRTFVELVFLLQGLMLSRNH